MGGTPRSVQDDAVVEDAAAQTDASGEDFVRTRSVAADAAARLTTDLIGIVAEIAAVTPEGAP